MKIHLKSLFLLCFFLIQLLHAKDMSYAFHLSSSQPYVNEAIFLDVNISQENHSQVMMFNFTLKKSEAYTFHQLSLKENEEYHDLQQQYRYLIYPKRAGKISLEFEMTKSLTNDAKVAYAISGDRDNVKGLEKEDIVVNVKPLALKIKSLPSNVDLVGDFTLTHDLDKQETDAFDPVNLKVELKGRGGVDAFALFQKSKKYTLFTKAPKIKAFYTNEGSSTSIEWEYAISSADNFVLPKVTLKAFNPKTQKLYALVLPSYAIQVNEVKKASLLDKEDAPLPSKGVDWDFWKWIFSYVFVFLAGFLMPRDLFKSKVLKEKSEENILAEKISTAKTHRELLQVLLLENDGRFAKAISLLEGVVYNGGKESLSKIKAQFA